MRKALLLFFLTSFCYSQKSSVLQTLKKELENKKAKLEILDIQNKIDSIDREITFQQIKERAVKTTLKKDAKLYLKPSTSSSVIANPKSKQAILIVEEYKYGPYYRAIFDKEIGYISKKVIRITKEIRGLSIIPSGSSNYTSPVRVTKSKSRSSKRSYGSYKTYYRGPRGGCYYINSNGNKTYVARNKCN